MPYTRCPACATGFRISASQLSTAGGQVRCGRCGARFDALDALSDAPSELPSPRAPHRYRREALAEQRPARTQPIDADEVPSLGALLQKSKPEPPGEQQTPSTTQNNASEGLDLGGLLKEAEPERPEPGTTGPVPLAFPDSWSDFAASYLHYEAQPDTAKPKLAASVAKGAGILVLTVTLLLQLSWLERDQLVYSPQGRALLGGLCRVAGCEPPPRRDLDQIEIIRRSILPRKQQPGVLDLELVFVNQASFAQPYPRVRMSLLSPQGEPTARRTFSPGEYLAPGAAQKALVQPQELVQVRLELVEPDRVWAGYRFDFL